jgi:AcrR family transcriptional regulator
LAAPRKIARERARLQVDERRAQLLELGLQLFTDHTYDELSIDDIAAAAGISKGLLYHYWPSKRDYYVEVVRRAADHLVERTAEAGVDASPDSLLHGLDAYLDFVDQHARSFTAVMRGGVGSDAEVQTIVEAARTAIADRIISRLGVDAPSPLLRAALRGWIGFVEAASLDWLARRDLPRDELRALCAHMALAALTSTGALPNDLALS